MYFLDQRLPLIIIYPYPCGRRVPCGAAGGQCVLIIAIDLRWRQNTESSTQSFVIIADWSKIVGAGGKLTEIRLNEENEINNLPKSFPSKPG